MKNKYTLNQILNFFKINRIILVDKDEIGKIDLKKVEIDEQWLIDIDSEGLIKN